MYLFELAAARVGDSDIGAVEIDQFLPSALIELEKDSAIELFPNPSSSYVELRNYFGKGELKIYNDLGQYMFSNRLEETERQIDISKLNQGGYYLIIDYDIGLQVAKFIKI